MGYLIPIALFLFINIPLIWCSDGDQSPFYQKCLKNCMNQACTKDGEFTSEAASKQDIWCRLLGWSCQDECRYDCMWKTVRAFEERRFQIPKFHGKWPFKRFLGMQEPASAIFSLFNLAAHVHMIRLIYKDKSYSVRHSPMLRFWYIFFVVCANAWIWSFIFHTRDTPFTEFMDYSCALSMVLSLLVAAVVRILYYSKVISGILVFMKMLCYLEHVRYLHAGMTYGRIDYAYNMTVNVLVGVAGATLWLVWSLWMARRGRRHALRVAAFTLVSGGALLLELTDFAPVRAALDAHALWHLATAPLPLLFYRFVMDDIAYLQNSQIERKTEFKLA